MNANPKTTQGQSHLLTSQTNQSITSNAIPRLAIKNSHEIFDRYDVKHTGKIPLISLKSAIRDVFTREKISKPQDSDLDTLYNSFGYSKDQEVSFREFKRILKQLAGYKTYNSTTIGVQKEKPIYEKLPTTKGDSQTVVNVTPSTTKVENITTANELQKNPLPAHQQGLVGFMPKTTGSFQESLSDPAKDPNLHSNVSNQQTVKTYSVMVYPISKNAIKNSQSIFKKYDKEKKDSMDINDLEAALADVYALDGKVKPQHNDVVQLLEKYQFQKSHRVSATEFKRILKELAGYKKYDHTNIGIQKYNLHPGPYPGDPNYVDPYNSTNNTIPQSQNISFSSLPPEYIAMKFPLTQNAIYYSKAVFNNREINKNGVLDLATLESAIRDVYAVDKQIAPSTNDILYVLKKHNFNWSRSLSYKEFRRLLKELSGSKTYEKGSFGFIKKIFKK